jgi:hypothetical protein
MLSGRFGNTTGRPYMEGRLALPRLGIFGDISFIVDTGADKSVLMPLDGSRMSLDYGKLGPTVETVGIGGLSKDFIEPAVLAFVDPGNWLYVYSFQIHISPPNPQIGNIPSLLGRDILNQWVLTHDRPHNRLVAEVVTSTFQISLKAPEISPPADTSQGG